MKAASLEYLLNNVDPTINPYVFLLGYYVPDDGAEGEFFWDATSTATADGGTIFDSLFPEAPSTGRWKRLHDQVLNIKWFGAKGVIDVEDEENFYNFNDAPFIQMAIAAMPTDGGHLLFPPGTYIQGDGTNPDYVWPNTIPPQDEDMGTDISFKFTQYKNFKISGKGAIIKAHASNTCINNNKGFYFDECSDGWMEGLEYDGNIELRHPENGDAAPYNKQNGFHFSTCKRITLSDVKSNNCVMDGFHIDSPDLYLIDPETIKWSEDILLIGCQANYNYRQGMSVVNAKRVTCIKSEFSYTGDIYGTLPMAGIDFEESIEVALRGQTDCLIDNCLFAENKGTGLSFHTGTRNCRVVHSTFINNDFFNAPDVDHLSVNNEIISNTFINSGIDCQGGGELIENNIFNGDTSRDYTINLVDTIGSYTAGHSRAQVFGNNYVENTLSGTPSGKFGTMLIDSNNVIVESNRFINVLNTETGNNVLYCNQSGYSFLNNEYEATGSGVIGKFYFQSFTPLAYAGNKINPVYSSPSDTFPAYKTYLPATGNECTAEISRLITLETGKVFDIFFPVIVTLIGTFPVFGTLKVTIGGSYQSIIAEGSKEEIFWKGISGGSSRKLIYSIGSANRAIHFTDVYLKDDRYCITGFQPDLPYSENQILSVQLSFLSDGGFVFPVNELSISAPYTNPTVLTFKNIYSGGGAGDTASRPAASASTYYTDIEIGAMYFDTTLGQPIWFNGTNWVDSGGTTV